MDWPTLSPASRQILTAAGLTAALEAELGLFGRLTPARAAAALLVTVPVALRLRLPVTASALVVSGVLVEAALGVRLPDQFIGLACLLVALFAVASATTGARLVTGAALAFVGITTASLVTETPSVVSPITGAAIVGLGLLIGRALGVLRFETDALAERASQLERERDERAQVAVAEERRRIARELHDVIGHSISVMGVQAGAVRSVLRDDQNSEREALISVERLGRQAVGEVRRLLGLLRSDEDGAGKLMPSLRQVEELVSEMSDAGLSVHLTVQGDLTALPPGVDLAGFRILQEALTNALKHAPRAHVDARVSCAAQALEIEVTNDGPPVSHPSSGAGHGLVGMRERSSLYGGDLVAGPRADGGFGVRARIPLEPLS